MTGIKAIAANEDHVVGPMTIRKSGRFWFRWQNFELSDDYFFNLKPHRDIIKINGDYVAFYRRKHVRDTLVSSNMVSDAISKLGKTPPD
jgi:hypothetical protein